MKLHHSTELKEECRGVNSKARNLVLLSSLVLGGGCESAQMTVEPCRSVVPDYGVCGEKNPIPGYDACKQKLECPPDGEFFTIPPSTCNVNEGLNREAVEQAADQYMNSGEYGSAARWYMTLAQEYYMACEYGKMDEFLAKTYSAVLSAEGVSLKSPDLLSAYMSLGDFEMTFRRRYSDAATLLEKAAGLARALDDKMNEADAGIRISTAMYCLGRDAESADAQSSAYIIALIIDRCTPDDTMEESIIFNGIADLALMKGDIQTFGEDSERYADLWEGPYAGLTYWTYWESKFNGYIRAMFGYCCSGDKCGLERSANKLAWVRTSGYQTGPWDEERLAELDSMGCLGLLP